MRVPCLILALTVVVCSAAPGPSNEDDGKIELFSGVAIERDPSGEEKINVRFEPGELKEAARTFEEARGKIKKYAPLLTSIGVKVLAVAGLLFGGLTLLVTKALVMAKLAFIVAAALGIQKLLNGGGLSNISGKLAGIQSSQQWTSPTASASSYPYARSSNIANDANDLAYKAQLTS